ncbi:MAG: DNA (cytosine-5-)-methyltransferase [Gammaproteobacteria bacterium]|nr:DNA (cytosine-5-)-methyltransferase [Gammaproteobacteria bacterium]
MHYKETELLTDLELLEKVSFIYSQQYIADITNHPREVINRWLKDKQKSPKDSWLTYNERLKLEQALPNPQDSNDFTFIDLFAGIGGIRKGFEDQGGKCVFTSEYDKYAVKTYLANYHCDHPIHGDIREITQPKGISKSKVDKYIDSKIPNHDVLLAGFPCQPFSIAGVSKKKSLGRTHGFEDETQGTLFFDVARIIKAKQPHAVMLENVKNLKSHDKGRTFKVIMNTLSELGYEVVNAEVPKGKTDPKVINGKNFVPQNRERIVIVAFKKESSLAQSMNLKDISDFYPSTPPMVADILDDNKRVDKKYTLTPKLWQYLKNYADKHKKAGNGFGFGLVTSESEHTRTLSARYYKDGSEILVSRGPRSKPRRLTPKECARLMGFTKKGEDHFVIPVSDTQAYKQFGNSVVVPVFASVASLMKPLIIKAKELNSSKRKAAA